MAVCKVTNNIGGKACEYTLAGVKGLWITNWYQPLFETEAEAAVPDNIEYVLDADDSNIITAIVLPTGEKWFQIFGADNTLQWSDTLLAGANGAKYRQHQVQGVIDASLNDALDSVDAISLGTFVACALTQSNEYVLLGVTSGIKAPAAGMDYGSGAAEADATGWTLLLNGAQTAVHLKFTGGLTPLAPIEVVEP